VLEIFELDAIPLYNQDYEGDENEPVSVRVFKEKIREAGGLLMVTPEYNYSVSGVLKNAIDWVSRPAATSPLVMKPTAIIGVGGRFGTVRAQLHLCQICLFLNMPVLMKPEIYVINAWEKFDGEGNLKDEQTRVQIETLLEAFIPWIKQHTR
jgi:chromate reductase, NAD(P)H dehydrogenase (quinone)